MNGRRFTAVSIADIDAEQVDSLRDSFFETLSRILSPEQPPNAIMRLPGLHGSDLLRGYSDEQKIYAVSELLRHFTRLGGRFRRLGYFDDSVPYLEDRNARISGCVTSAFLRKIDTPPSEVLWMIVAELDKEGLRAGLNSLDQHISMYYQGAKRSSWENFSVNFQGLLGHFFALKDDLGCQAADISGYVAYKAEKAQTPFALELKKVFEAFEGFYDFNSIIEMKEL